MSDIGFIIKSENMSDVARSQNVGSTESTGIPGVNVSKKITLSDGKKFLWKPKSGEKVSRWRLVPKKSLYKRERVAYLVSKQLGFDMVPKVTIAQYNSDIGSLQEWVDPAFHISGDYMEFIENLDDDQRIKAGIFDLIIANSDRHGKNFLVQLEEV